MTATELRNQVVTLYKSRLSKNKYTQEADRGYFFGKPEGTNPGYSDCSSSVRVVYKRVLGVDIGSNTDAQVRSKRGTVVDTICDPAIRSISKATTATPRAWDTSSCISAKGNAQGTAPA